MPRRLYREFYLLPRGEQRGLLMLSALLILSLVFRITVPLLPDPEPEGLEEFEQEAAMLMAALAEADSLKYSGQDSLSEPLKNDPVRTLRSGERRSGSSIAYPIDVNRADSADLLPLPGIGPVYAGRIVKYRNLLGGFLSVDQLGEVYGISLETIQKIRDKVSIDTSAIRKIRIDSATFRELLRHPYLEYEDVKALVEYRDFKRDIESSDELKINHILSDSTIGKLNGYVDYR